MMRNLIAPECNTEGAEPLSQSLGKGSNTARLLKQIGKLKDINIIMILIVLHAHQRYEIGTIPIPLKFQLDTMKIMT